MIKTLISTAAAALLSAAAATAAATAASAEEQSEKRLTLFGDIAWQEAIPGVQLALAWGAPGAGDDIWLLRMEPGAALPSHAHTNDYWGLTIQGAWVHIHEDGSETATASGDFALIKGGVFHGDRCDGEVACIGLLDFSGDRDAIFPE